MEIVKVRVAGEHFEVRVKERRGKMVMNVSSNVSKIKKETRDKVEMLSILKHFEDNGVLVDGDFNLMRKFIKGESPNMAEAEETSILTLYSEVVL